MSSKKKPPLLPIEPPPGTHPAVWQIACIVARGIAGAEIREPGWIDRIAALPPDDETVIRL